MTENPPQVEQEPKDILSFEEFTVRNPVPRYNNLVLFFYTTGIGPEFYRVRDFFKRFEQEHPELERRLREGLMSLKGGFSYSEDLRKFDEDLYTAYKIMRGYGATNGDLFG